MLELVAQNIARLQERLLDLGTITFRDDLDELLADADKQLQDWWGTEELGRLKLIDTEAEVEQSLTKVKKLLGSFFTLLTQHIASAKAEMEGILLQIRNAFSDNSSMQRIADLRANAEKRLREVTTLRDQYTKTWKRLFDCLKLRKQMGDKLIETHDRIAGIN